MNSSLEIKANAKLNLFLDITGRRKDGYHELNTVMQMTDLADNVKITLSDGEGIYVECDNPEIPDGEKNIAYRAAELFMREISAKYKVDIQIEKHIPAGGGMGGSSTDGAAVLRGMNLLCGVPFTTERLAAFGAQLGADVPFCICGTETPTALCTGIGEIITPLKNLPDCVFLIVQPDFSCDTKVAYRLYDENQVPANTCLSDIKSAIADGNINAVTNEMYNIFETLYCDERIADIKREFAAAGVPNSILTGSGSCVFAILESSIKAAECAAKLNAYRKIIAKPLKNT